MPKEVQEITKIDSFGTIESVFEIWECFRKKMICFTILIGQKLVPKSKESEKWTLDAAHAWPIENETRWAVAKEEVKEEINLPLGVRRFGNKKKEERVPSFESWLRPKRLT